MKLKENEIIPNSEFFIMENETPVKKNTFEFFKNKKVILFGLPGAYTSVCSAKHLPGYVANYDKYKAKGVDLIVCISVNDPFVMDAWGKSQNVTDKIVMMADPFLSFTKIFFNSSALKISSAVILDIRELVPFLKVNFFNSSFIISVAFTIKLQ